jgi:glycosyltransferase involved in cell wall biosynthesis
MKKKDEERAMEQETVSVIIPVYGVEAYLQTCVDSVCAQTWKNLEIILVDDGSPDNCPALCDALAERDGRIRVIHKENGGLSDARNRGIEAATGRYLMFVDSDDYIQPTMVQTLHQALVEAKADVSLCDYARVDTDGVWLDQDKPLPGAVLTGLEAMEQMELAGQWWRYAVAWNKLYKREIFASLRFPKGKIHEDDFIIHRVFAQCQRVAVVPQRLYFYVQRSDSIMGVTITPKRLQAVEALLSRYDFYVQEGYAKELSNACLGKAYRKLWQTMDGLPVWACRQQVRPYVEKIAKAQLRRGSPQGLWLWLGYGRRLMQTRGQKNP